MRLRLLGLGLVASGIGARDGCSRVSEPLASPSVARSVVVETPRAGMVVPRLVGQSPHDAAAFTQGLVVSDGALLESTGGYGTSTLRRVDLATGKVRRSIALPNEVFGEGLTRLKGEVFQLTWQEHRCFVYDEATFEPRREMTYGGEGWGLTSDGALLIMSDGTETLRFRDPVSFREVRALRVQEGGRPVDQLNELEWVRGEILANIWHTRLVARIDPRSGEVLDYLDLAGLPEPHHEDPEAVLNGIAYDEAHDRLFVTGKLWGSMFEIARSGW
jgi:glutamine cyclotransferase